jgi:hypothetical protein
MLCINIIIIINYKLLLSFLLLLLLCVTINIYDSGNAAGESGCATHGQCEQHQEEQHCKQLNGKKKCETVQLEFESSSRLN